MNWQNVSKVGMPKKNGRYLIKPESGDVRVSQYYTHHGDYFFGKVKATHWCEIEPACCDCGAVDGVDYCCDGVCVPF
ncbi:hypothetical protein NVP2095A_61 [Vibrio phage 2.095.A._10N.286.46.E10]|nr:hypothetical protein NVP2095A_61 [Vibrio phage 2.095.A._10N.286.46.E10]AUS02219.1 hypothetical protein NVP2095B_61 [Vibrio phage 2.095.B._10N.286.46.E10]